MKDQIKKNAILDKNITGHIKISNTFIVLQKQ